MSGSDSIMDSSKIDWALSVTGPYESTAIVTGPMPRNPNATRPNANTAGAIIRVPSGEPPRRVRLTRYATDIKPMMTIPSQYALKLPATRPDRMFSEAPPSREDVTTSFTCADSTEVKILTSSGMMAPASVPHVMTVDSFHHRVGSPPMFGTSRYDAM